MVSAIDTSALLAPIQEGQLDWSPIGTYFGDFYWKKLSFRAYFVFSRFERLLMLAQLDFGQDCDNFAFCYSYP